MFRFFTTLSLALLLSACSDSSDSYLSNPFSGYVSDLYADNGNWLCHPDLSEANDVCAGDLDATIVYADGSIEIETHHRADQPAVDCFYVYPTVSEDPSGNSDLDEGLEEIYTAYNQAARYSRFCRMFAPVYRQGTLGSIFAPDIERDPQLAYGDVFDSFRHYMANHNNGRGFILIGHSQGAGHLARLVAEEVESDDYLQAHMISAHLLGATLRTPEGADIGGTFATTPICRSSDQTGCLVSYVSYRDSDPFLASGEGRFGTGREGELAVCANPAALSGGSAALDSYLPTERADTLVTSVIIPRADGPFADSASAPDITTPFFKMPDFITGECVVNEDRVSYLKVTTHPDPDDPRADDFNGEFFAGDGWGLHLVDVNIVMGNLVDLGQTQAQSWLSDQR